MSYLHELRVQLEQMLTTDIPLIKAAVDAINAEIGTDNAENIAAIKAAIDAGFALEGDAEVANVLDGKFFYKDNYQTKLTGTMPNNAGDVPAISSHSGGGGTIHVVPATGYTDGADDASVITDADFVAANIKHNVGIFGLTGSYDTEAVAPIEAATVLDGKVGFVNGAKVTGSMTDSSADIVPDGTAIVIPAGYHDGTKHVTADVNLAAENIKTGVEIYGATGTYDTEAGDPIEVGTVLDGKIGFVNGSKIIGVMPNNAGDNAALSTHPGVEGTGEIHVVPTEGYVDGSDDAVVITDADFIASNIRTSANIFGMVGTYDTEAGDPIDASSVMNGKVGFVNGTKITGNNANLIDTTEAGDPAAAGDIANGKVAFVNGVKITGTAV